MTNSLNNLLKMRKQYAIFYVISFLVISCIVIFTMAACVSILPPPIPKSYSDPTANETTQFTMLRLGIIQSENVRKSIEHIEENRELCKSVSIPNTAALEDLNSDYILNGLNQILKNRFRDIISLKDINEASVKNVDICMIIDLRIKLGERSGKITTVYLAGIFMDNNGSVIDTISGEGTSKVPFPATTARFKPTAKFALSSFSKNLESSTMLISKLKSLEESHKFVKIQKKKINSDSVSSKTITKVGQRWSVIIGISNYQDSRIPSLRYASRDARAFYDWAISQQGGKYAPANVKLLLNAEATVVNIKSALFSWLRKALQEDMVTIYFAGHGSPESPDLTKNLFLLPYDAIYDNISATSFPMWDIETALKRFIKAKKVVVIADACHSGGVGESFDIARRANRAIKINPISSGIQNLSQVGDGVCVISASSDNQFSQESKKWGGGHGVFTYFLLKGLRGDADYNKDNSVSLGELTSYLSEQVRRETKNAQSPTIAGRYDPALTIGK